MWGTTRDVITCELLVKKSVDEDDLEEASSSSSSSMSQQLSSSVCPSGVVFMFVFVFVFVSNTELLLPWSVPETVPYPSGARLDPIAPYLDGDNRTSLPDPTKPAFSEDIDDDALGDILPPGTTVSFSVLFGGDLMSVDQSCSRRNSDLLNTNAATSSSLFLLLRLL